MKLLLDSPVYNDKTVCGQFARALFGQMVEEVEKTAEQTHTEEEMTKIAVLFDGTAIFFEKQMRKIVNKPDGEKFNRTISVLKGIRDGAEEAVSEGNYTVAFIKNVVENLLNNIPQITNGEYEEKYQKAKDEFDDFVLKQESRGKKENEA